MKTFSTVLLAFAISAPFCVGADKMAKVSGWVSDEKCGAKGATASHADCAKKCEAEGSKLVVVADKDKSVMSVDNPDALKGHEGHHVRVAGKMTNGSLHVDNVTMLKQPKAKKQTGEHGTSGM